MTTTLLFHGLAASGLVLVLQACDVRSDDASSSAHVDAAIQLRGGSAAASTELCAEWNNEEIVLEVEEHMIYGGAPRWIGADAAGNVTIDEFGSDDASDFVASHSWTVRCDLFDLEVYFQNVAHGSWLAPSLDDDRVRAFARPCPLDAHAWSPSPEEGFVPFHLGELWRFQAGAVEDETSNYLGVDFDPSSTRVYTGRVSSDEEHMRRVTRFRIDQF